MEHGLFFDMCTVIQNGGNGPVNLAENILTDNHKPKTGGSQVLLGSAIDDPIPGYIHGTAENIRRHIRHQGLVPGFRHIGKLDTDDGRTCS